MKKMSTPFLKNTYLKVLIYAVIISLPLLGSDCDNSGVISGGNTSGDITGSWQLTYMTGHLQDVCFNEIVTFQANGTAILQCPGEQSIRRTYTVSNNVLTYSTGVQYKITTLTNTTLVLEGLNNISRTLTYVKLPTDHNGSSDKSYGTGKNSSDY